MSHPSLVTLHSMVHSFIEFCKPHHYDKAVIHEGSLFNMHLHFSTTVRNLQFIYLFKPKIHIKQFDNMCVKHISQLDYNVYLKFFFVSQSLNCPVKMLFSRVTFCRFLIHSLHSILADFFRSTFKYTDSFLDCAQFAIKSVEDIFFISVIVF